MLVELAFFRRLNSVFISKDIWSALIFAGVIDACCVRGLDYKYALICDYCLDLFAFELASEPFLKSF